MSRPAVMVALLLGVVSCTELLPLVEGDEREPGTTDSSGASTSRGADPSGSATASADDASTGATHHSATAMVDTTSGSGGWAWRREITVPRPPDEPVDAVPLRVHLDDGNFDFDRLRSAPDDLRFVDADGSTILPHEVERWDSGVAELWVLVPQIATGATIFMEYGHEDPPPAVAPWGVWPGATGVWHLGATLVDSSAAGNDGLVMGAEVGPGQIGSGHDYDGSVWDELPPSILGSAAGSVQLWFRAQDDQDPVGGVSALVHASGSASADLYGAEPELYFAILHSGVEQAVFHAFGLPSDDPGVIDAETIANVLDGQWHHVVLSWSVDAMEAWLLLDGTQLAVDDGTILIPPERYSSWTRLGNIQPTVLDRGFVGSIDEVRIYDQASTLERAQVESWAQRIGTAQIGPEQSVP